MSAKISLLIESSLIEVKTKCSRIEAQGKLTLNSFKFLNFAKKNPWI